MRPTMIHRPTNPKERFNINVYFGVKSGASDRVLTPTVILFFINKNYNPFK